MHIYIALAVALVALWLYAIVDAIRVPGSAWVATGRNKAAWVATLVVLNTAASAVYLLMIRRSVHTAAHEMATASAVEATRKDALAGGVRRCDACGFSSNPAAATTCRHCGTPL